MQARSSRRPQTLYTQNPMNEHFAASVSFLSYPSSSVTSVTMHGFIVTGELAAPWSSGELAAPRSESTPPWDIRMEGMGAQPFQEIPSGTNFWYPLEPISGSPWNQFLVPKTGSYLVPRFGYALRAYTRIAMYCETDVPNNGAIFGTLFWVPKRSKN